MHARSTSPRGGANTPAKEDPTAQRAVAAAAAMAPEDSDDRLPTDSVRAVSLPAVRALPLHAMPHTAVQCLQETLGRGEWPSRGSQGVCYTAHTYLPLDVPSEPKASVVLARDEDVQSSLPPDVGAMVKDNFGTYALPSVHAWSRDHGR